MVYQPVFRKQGDGSRCQWYNCSPASHSMATDRHQRGVDPPGSAPWRPTPPVIRNKISPYSCGGTSHVDNANAVRALYGVQLWVRYDVPWNTFVSMIISGRGAAVSIRYSVISGTRYDSSPGFTGGHDVYVNERRSTDGAFAVYDPLADGRRIGIWNGPRWWPASVLKAAAGAWTGAGLVDVSLTRDTEP